eukprot:scaffold7644_cov121-Skeletonema_marinoi.AAC.1
MSGLEYTQPPPTPTTSSTYVTNTPKPPQLPPLDRKQRRRQPISMNEDPKTSPDEAKRKKNRPGRSSRRRKHKARSILLEASGGETTAADGGATEDKNQSVVPSDRAYTLDGVKFRRREQWLKQRIASNINDDVTSCDQQQQHQQQHQVNEEEGTSLDPKDDYQLKAQLGFVPGNAICVAARTSLQEVFTSPTSGRETGGNDDPSPPAVLKLYPMAIRETYRGGTTDGRKFKARRRGAERSKKSNDKKADDGNDETKKKKKKERRWFIESPSDEQTADATRIDTPQDDDDDDESPKHIIEPFPTMYWLTSPKLRILISKMELSKDNNVQTMEQRLRSSQDNLDQMERAHKSYGRSRWELLTPQDKKSVMQRGWENALDERRGVAGISLVKGRFDCVKCLHAHVAHYLAQVAEWEEESQDGGECKRDDLNLVGKWTMESIEALPAEDAL